MLVYCSAVSCCLWLAFLKISLLQVSHDHLISIPKTDRREIYRTGAPAWNVMKIAIRVLRRTKLLVTIATPMRPRGHMCCGPLAHNGCPGYVLCLPRAIHKNCICSGPGCPIHTNCIQTRSDASHDSVYDHRNNTTFLWPTGTVNGTRNPQQWIWTLNAGERLRLEPYLCTVNSRHTRESYICKQSLASSGRNICVSHQYPTRVSPDTNLM